MRRMMICKTCGAEIAKSANTCPHCGAKQHQGVYAVCTLIAVFTFLYFVFKIVDVINSPSEPSAQDPAEPSIEISAVDLWGEYCKNEVAADDAYKGKYLKLTGTIEDISADMLTDDPCIVLSSGDSLGLYGIQCFFTDDEGRDAIGQLEDGQEITIIGKCTGRNIVIQLTACKLPEKQSENLTLGPGTYVVGEDIPAGKYDCVAASGFGVLRGEIASAGEAGFVQTMGNVSSSVGEDTVSVDGTSSYSNLLLQDGDTIYIEMSLSVEFIQK